MTAQATIFAGISTHILIEQIIAEIEEQYLADDTPWIVGFSGGKDSTTLLQLTFYALLELHCAATIFLRILIWL